MLFKAALSAAPTPPDAGQYASAFVTGMLYNLGAAALICLLLMTLAKTQRAGR